MKDTLLDNLHMADINPRICGVEACAPGHSFGPAVREYFLLHYVVRGKGIFRRGKREYTLQAGEIFVIRPGEVTYYEADMRDPWEYMWAGFDCAPPFAALLEQDVLEQVFEDNYARQEKAFLSLIDAYAGKRNDHGVREMVAKIYRMSLSSPWPQAWMKKPEK